MARENGEGVHEAKAQLTISSTPCKLPTRCPMAASMSYDLHWTVSTRAKQGWLQARDPSDRDTEREHIAALALLGFQRGESPACCNGRQSASLGDCAAMPMLEKVRLVLQGRRGREGGDDGRMWTTTIGGRVKGVLGAQGRYSQGATTVGGTNTVVEDGQLRPERHSLSAARRFWRRNKEEKAVPRDVHATERPAHDRARGSLSFFHHVKTPFTARPCFRYGIPSAPHSF